MKKNIVFKNMSAYPGAVCAPVCHRMVHEQLDGIKVYVPVIRTVTAESILQHGYAKDKKFLMAAYDGNKNAGLMLACMDDESTVRILSVYIADGYENTSVADTFMDSLYSWISEKTNAGKIYAHTVACTDSSAKVLEKYGFAHDHCLLDGLVRVFIKDF